MIAINEAELDALHGLGPLAALLYIELRRQMDYRTGETGRSTPISLAGLARACETHTPRGAGTQITQPTEKEIRNALDRRHLASTAGVLDLARSPAATSIFLPGPGRAFTLGLEWKR